MTKQQMAQGLAEKVAAFIRHNGIDVNEVPMDVIVSGYFKAQAKTTKEAGAIVKASFIRHEDFLGELERQSA